MGEMVAADQVITAGMSSRRAWRVVLLLSISMGIMMTGFGIVFPIFARRLGELGSGVEALGLMIMAYALTNIVGAPLMGVLADRLGRRPVVLGSLATFVAVNLGFLLANSTNEFILIRAIEGFFMAGLSPAALGIIADIAPEDSRGRWVGIFNGGASAGWILGPALGGVLYDSFGFAAPFIASAIMASLAFAAAFFLIPETRPRIVRQREALRHLRTAAISPTKKATFWDTIPRPISTFGILLFVNFMLFFSWTFIDPALMFYVYDELLWTSAQFGIAVGGYGAAAMFGELTLGRLSDRYGRKPVLIAGIFLFSAQFFGVVFSTSLLMIMLAFFIGGLGESLIWPALNALYMDITPEQHKARVMGITGSAGSLGGVVGPALVILVAGVISPRSIFAISLIVVLSGTLLVFIILKEPKKVTKKATYLTLEATKKRSMAAQASLRGVVTRASASRSTKVTGKRSD